MFFPRLLRDNAVAVTGWLRNYQELGWLTGGIPYLMGSPGRNMQPLACMHLDLLALNLHDSFPRENKEKLLSIQMVVADFRGSRRHALPDHAQGFVLQQVPAVTIGSPNVVIGIGDAGWLHDSSSSA